MIEKVVVVTANSCWNIWNFRKKVVVDMLGDGHRVIILAPQDDFTQSLVEVGCEFIPLKMSAATSRILSQFHVFYQYWKKFRRLKPDMVFGFTIKNNILGALAARVTGIVFIPNITGLGTAFLSGKLLGVVAEGLYKLAFKGVPLVFFQNSDDMAMFRNRKLISSETAAVVLPGSGIDLEEFGFCAFNSDGPFTFLMVSRLTTEKGVLEFVDASKIVMSKGYDIKCLLLGGIPKGNRKSIRQETIGTWVQNEIIEYITHQEDVRPYLQQAHFVVLPSYREGAPKSLIEAAAMGRPVISTDVPGCREVVEHNFNGYLCAPKSASSLASAMEKMLNAGCSEWSRMGRNGRHKIENKFDIRFVSRTSREVIRRLS